MSEDINVESIRKGDRVKVSLHGLPEYDWLEVSAAFPNCAEVIMPDGRDRLLTPSEITAHEPATPARPDWWGSWVLAEEDGSEHWLYVASEDHYVCTGGLQWGPSDFFGGADMTVVVDRDGNQPAEDKFARMWNSAKAERDEARANRDEERELRKRTEAERDEARADLVAFRAKVAEVRDFLSSRADTHERRVNRPFDRGAAYVGHDAAARLSAILDGTDQ